MGRSSNEPSVRSSGETRSALANTTKTPPQWRGATPRWLVRMIQWATVEAGVYRVNQTKETQVPLRPLEKRVFTSSVALPRAIARGTGALKATL
jgi:hypothetical protein